MRNIKFYLLLSGILLSSGFSMNLEENEVGSEKSSKSTQHSVNTADLLCNTQGEIFSEKNIDEFLESENKSVFLNEKEYYFVFDNKIEYKNLKEEILKKLKRCIRLSSDVVGLRMFENKGKIFMNPLLGNNAK